MCTGNVCRSPMAEAFLQCRLNELGVDARVSSAGLLQAGSPATALGVEVLRDYGLDSSTHRSRRLSSELVDLADLVLCMAREHLREVVLLAPDAWPRCFTLKELVRRGTEVGARAPAQPFDEWLAKVHAGRSRSDLLGAAPDDDVDDPIGMGRPSYVRTADEIDNLVRRLVELGWGLAG